MSGYAPAGRFLWDSWFLPLAEGYRVYHLDAPLDSDPESRHDRAQIRTAVSQDIVHWNDEGLCLPSGPDGAWDDGPIWTGSTLLEADRYALFYTARNQRDGPLQRIGLALSKDGVHWDRSNKPLLEADTRWYETDEPSPVYRAFRDPFVLWQDELQRYLMYFTAKTRDGDPTYRGCIGLATAPALEGPWEQEAPVLAPGHFAEMECPQVLERDGQWYLFFTTKASNYSASWAAHVGSSQTGLHGYRGPSPRGPFQPIRGHAVIAGNNSNLFSVRFLEQDKALGWYMSDRTVSLDGCEREERAYTLSPPYRVSWDQDGPTIHGLPEVTR